MRAQTQWLGWQGTEETLLAWMADNHAATRSGDRTRTAAVAAAFDALIRTQLQRAPPLGARRPSDPTTALLAATHDGQPLDDDDIVSILRNWTAGDLGSMAAALGWWCGSWLHMPTCNNSYVPTRKVWPLPSTRCCASTILFLVNRRRTTCDVAVGACAGGGYVGVPELDLGQPR